MSLAQKFERPSVAKFGVVTSMPEPVLPPAPPNVSLDFRPLSRRPADVGTPVRVPVEPRDVTRPPSEVALDLLSEVSVALPALMNRCRILEASLGTAHEQARTDLEAANEVVREWQQIANALKAQVDHLQQEVVALRERAEGAEGELATVRATAEKSQHAAAEAECLTSLFQNKVISSFGVGSETHAILETVRSRTQQMLTA